MPNTKAIPTLAGARARRAMEEAPLPPITDAERRVAPPAQYQRDIPPIPPEYVETEGDQIFDDTPPPPARSADEVTFSRGPARRPQLRVADPLLQWASGLTTNDRRLYAGWLVEAGKHDVLDAALETAGCFPFVTIKHGSGNLVTHWAIETANLFLIADGVQSIGEMKTTPQRYGVAFGWRPGRAESKGLRTESGARHSVLSPQSSGLRPQSQLRARVLLRELLAVGYEEPLLLTVKGTLTGDLLRALEQQYRVLDMSTELRKQSGKNPELPFYAFSIPLGPGPEVTRGSGSATKEITPMVAAIPDPVTKEHLLAHWIKRGWVQLVESRIDDTLRWSEAESAAIAAGADSGGEGGEGL